MRKAPWNKGLTAATSPKLAAQAKKKSDWWKTHDTTETRKKIGDASRGRVAKRGAESSGWKGGKFTTKRDGYIHLYAPGHPYARKSSKGTGGYVLEHRLVMEKVLGRYLEPDEDVNHINGVKDDNREENLMLVRHNAHYYMNCCPKCGHEWGIR